VNAANADLHALQRGDDAALGRLIARWEKPLFAFAWRYLHNTADAHEMIAEVFVRLHQQRSRLNPGTNLSGWLFTTLVNLCHNHHRWRRRHPAVSLEAPDGLNRTVAGTVPVDAPSPDRALEHGEALDALALAIEQLPHDLKVTLLLHHYEQLSYAEIGGITACSERGVETRLYRARQYLRAELASFLRETVEP
jgi:RNA polymerase sigma-70 factor (ECF subfamily)